MFKKKHSNNWKDKKRGGDRKYDNGRRSDSGMHTATCADCSEKCQVPFKPNGRKPVLCSDCFRRSGGNSFDNKPPRTAERRESSDGVVRELKALNDKMDQLLDALAYLSEAEDEE
jgi:CxxC-x17-CxxC domain-containing protein